MIFDSYPLVKELVESQSWVNPNTPLMDILGWLHMISRTPEGTPIHKFLHKLEWACDG